VIKRINGFYVVVSERMVWRGGKMVRLTFGKYKNREDAEKRLRQVEYFKSLKDKRK